MNTPEGCGGEPGQVTSAEAIGGQAGHGTESRPRIAGNLVVRWAQLGSAGVVVSVCYGPFGPTRACCWTVTAMGPEGQEFDRPFRATSFAHAIEIAEIEALERGWVAR